MCGTNISFSWRHRCELVLFFFSFGKRKEESHLYNIPLFIFYLSVVLHAKPQRKRKEAKFFAAFVFYLCAFACRIRVIFTP
jgi:hypothetical protein